MDEESKSENPDTIIAEYASEQKDLKVSRE